MWVLGGWAFSYGRGTPVNAEAAVRKALENFQVVELMVERFF